jgi:hypothetical protein
MPRIARRKKHTLSTSLQQHGMSRQSLRSPHRYVAATRQNNVHPADCGRSRGFSTRGSEKAARATLTAASCKLQAASKLAIAIVGMKSGEPAECYSAGTSLSFVLVVFFAVVAALTFVVLTTVLVAVVFTLTFVIVVVAVIVVVVVLAVTSWVIRLQLRHELQGFKGLRGDEKER